MTSEERLARWLLGLSIAVAFAGVAALLLRSPDDDAPTAADPLSDFGHVAVRVQPEDGTGSLLWCLLAAVSADQRSRGLMEVTDLGRFEGMAFVYDEDVDHGFYMRNTPTPLSIAWISAAGEVVSTADMAPCGDREGCPVYPPGGRYRYAVEVFQGRLDDLGITEGATVLVGGPCPSP
jgi:uncharacterized membrane protein (UPF0127 family)/predicted outer membrane lipoprotein